MSSLEIFGIHNEKLFLEKLLNKFSDLSKSILDESLIDTAVHSIFHSIYSILYISNKQPYYLILKKNNVTSGGFGSIVFGYIITIDIFNKLFPNEHFSDFLLLVKKQKIENIIQLINDYNISEIVIKYPIDTKINLYNLFIENTILGLLCLNSNTSKYVPQLIKMFYFQNKIYTCMEKLDGSIHYDLKKFRNQDKKIYDNLILSYLLQIAYALYIIYKEYPIFSHRDLKPNNTMYRIVDTNTINIQLDNINFNYSTYGYKHYIIDFGFSCLNDFHSSNVSGICKSKSRDLTQFIFVLLNFNYSIFSDKLIGYLGYILDINSKCNLWRNIFTKKTKKTNKKNTLCNSISSFDKYLYRYLNQDDFDNPKAYPENIIKDIYNYQKNGYLPSNKQAIKTYNLFR